MNKKRKEFYKVVEDNIGIIRKLCRAYTDVQEDFEDYVQEVCYQLWKSMGSFRGESKKSTWVYRVTLNVCLTMIKKQKRLTIIATEDKDIQKAIEINSEDDSQAEQIKILYASITQLSPIDRSIIMLYLDKLTHSEISEILGLSTSNVGVRINRIKRKLKEIVNG